MSLLWDKLQAAMQKTNAPIAIDNSPRHRVCVFGMSVEISDNELDANMRDEQDHIEKMRKKSLGLI